MRFQDVCRQYGIRFKKQLGQNLLLDENINRIMVDAADLSQRDDVVEVGAGLGALTEQLQRRAGRVLAVEIDRAFLPCLEDRFGGSAHVRLFRGDILNHGLNELLEEYLPGGTSRKMVSNLPYYITTPILFHFWESEVFFSCMVVMVQEEVALRLTAPVGGSDYGVLTLAAQLYADAAIIHRVPRTCFKPRPEVDSCIVRLRNIEGSRYRDVDTRFLMRLIRAAFSQRRKTLRNALTHSGVFSVPRKVVVAAADAAGIDLERRAQTIGLEEYARMAREVLARLPSPAADVNPEALGAQDNR